ncbi:MAG TPA: hypothetical protein VFT59_01835 [Candidatus Saccharimonadales bacterium]|nr:hypothetical protein [Candidatus Saccharimonadales bacterium]
MDNEHVPKPRQSDEKISLETNPLETYIPGEISRRLDAETEFSKGATSHVESQLNPVPEPTLETMSMLHSSANPEMQLEYVEKLARLEPAQQQQVEAYIEKRQAHAWPLTEEKLGQLYEKSRSDTNAPIQEFAEELRAMTPEQRNQFSSYRNDRIVEEAKGLAESSSRVSTQEAASQPPSGTSKFVSMPGGENATATPQEMRRQAAELSRPDWRSKPSASRWWQKLWPRNKK